MTATKKRQESMGGMFRVKLRELLRQHSGMTLKQISKHVPGKGHSLYRALKRMPDVYISHWVEPFGEKQQAVFVAVHVPPDCPRPPKTKKTEEQRREYQRAYRLRRALRHGEIVERKTKPKTTKPTRIAGMTAEEAAARDKAMHDRYSNPPTYKPLN